jgi:hypothetical protein
LNFDLHQQSGFSEYLPPYETGKGTQQILYYRYCSVELRPPSMMVARFAANAREGSLGAM